MRTQWRKLSALNEDQLETLEHLLDFLVKVGVFKSYFVNNRRYSDTVATFRTQGANMRVDTQWSTLYDVEEIIVDDGRYSEDAKRF